MRYTNDVITGSRLTLSGAGVEPLRVSASRLISRPAPPTAAGFGRGAFVLRRLDAASGCARDLRLRPW